MFKILSIEVLLLLTLSHLNAADYCSESLCPLKGSHIACQNNGSFGNACRGLYEMVDMKPFQDLILHEHNFYRNMVAQGGLKCFPPAVRMPALVWNKELASLAELNARSCVFAHDKCRNTKEFRYAGQNIYYAKTSNLSISIEQFISEAVYLWFLEYLNADPELIYSYDKTASMTGHFTLLMTDRVTAVGCGLLHNLLPKELKKKQSLRIILACDYSSTNIRDQYVYKPGKSGSKCLKRHAKFKALCANRIDPNDIDWYY